MPQLYNKAAGNKKGYFNQDIAKALYITLESKLKNTQNAVLRDQAAIAILATIALNHGVEFYRLNNFSDAYFHLTGQLREFFGDKNFTNTQIHTAFIRLLEEKYVAQGQRDALVLAATSKVDPYLS